MADLAEKTLFRHHPSPDSLRALPCGSLGYVDTYSNSHTTSLGGCRALSLAAYTGNAREQQQCTNFPPTPPPPLQASLLPIRRVQDGLHHHHHHHQHINNTTILTFPFSGSASCAWYSVPSPEGLMTDTEKNASACLVTTKTTV